MGYVRVGWVGLSWGFGMVGDGGDDGGKVGGVEDGKDGEERGEPEDLNKSGDRMVLVGRVGRGGIG